MIAKEIMTAELRFTTSGYAGASLPNTSTTSFRINCRAAMTRNFVAERAVGESRPDHRAAPPPRPRRRGDRITTKFAAGREAVALSVSAYDPKPTYEANAGQLT